jgi:hypothetical protein
LKKDVQIFSGNKKMRKIFTTRVGEGEGEDGEMCIIENNIFN